MFPGKEKALRFAAGALLLLVIAWLGARYFGVSGKPGGRDRGRGGAPVEVGSVEATAIELRRTFSGTLEAQAEFVVAPKVSGRIVRLTVNVADQVARGQTVVELDNDEFVQEAAQAQADLAVARANLIEARSGLEIANREIERSRTLLERGVASDSQFDTVKAEQLAKQARLDVAIAQVTRAEAALQTARIRLGYTQVSADWSDGDDDRVVAERYVDAGQTVRANDPLIMIVELDPLVAVIHVTEKDYAYLRPGQPAMIATDAYKGEEFSGSIVRISPIFNENSRQARVELELRNPGHRLKPGMFIRATVLLERVEEAVVIPAAALTTRNDREGVFLVNADGETVSWHPVNVGIRAGERVQVLGGGVSGQVVTLGQQMIENDSKIVIPTEAEGAKGEKARASR